jgi:hypothetical protein
MPDEARYRIPAALPEARYKALCAGVELANLKNYWN